MTFQEKVDRKKDNRSQAINQKVSTEISKLNIIEEDDFNNKYLFGDTGGNIGIQNLIKYYYQEKNAEVGRTWSTPSLSNYTKSEWENILNNAITKSGDGSVYLDSNSDGIADKEINTSSQYFNDNGDNGENNGGLKNACNVLNNRIGQAATTTGLYTGPGGFNSSAEAQTAAEEYLYGSDLIENTTDDNLNRIGITIRGRRSRDVEIVITSSGVSPNITYNYEIGNGFVDSPNFYTDSTDINGYGGNERLNFENALSSLIIDLENYRDNILIPLRNELDKIFDGTNTLFDDMKDDLIDDSDNINTLISNLNGYVGDSGDIVTNGTLYGYQNYFTSLIDGSDSNFDIYLTELETLNSDIDTEISNRTSSLLNTYVGDTYQDKMKKWRFFWIKERIAKPQSTLVALDGIDEAMQNTNNAMQNANEALTVLYGDSDELREKWIKTPILYSAFFNPIINQDTGEIIKERIGVNYSGQQHATKYEIFRKLYEDISLNNEQWDISSKIDDYTELSNNGTIKLNYLDENIESGKEYVYRVKVYDDSNDPNYTYSTSLQSKIYDDENPVSYIFVNNEIGSTKINVSKDAEITAGSYILLFSSSGQNDGKYNIIKIQEQEDDKEVLIAPSLNKNEDGEIFKFTSFVSI